MDIVAIVAVFAVTVGYGLLVVSMIKINPVHKPNDNTTSVE